MVQKIEARHRLSQKQFASLLIATFAITMFTTVVGVIWFAKGSALTTISSLESLQGKWISKSFVLHAPSEFSGCSQIEIDVERVSEAKGDLLEEANYFDADVLDTISRGYRIAIYTISPNDIERRKVGDSSPGWLEIREGSSFLCFGPFGSHIRFKAAMQKNELNLRGQMLDAVFEKQ